MHIPLIPWRLLDASASPGGCQKKINEAGSAREAKICMCIVVTGLGRSCGVPHWEGYTSRDAAAVGGLPNAQSPQLQIWQGTWMVIVSGSRIFSIDVYGTCCSTNYYCSCPGIPLCGSLWLVFSRRIQQLYTYSRNLGWRSYR